MDGPFLCETCGAATVELFGYRRPEGWRWFCALHRLSAWYADKRLPPPDDGYGVIVQATELLSGDVVEDDLE
jgi:hypothetical protein